LTAHRTRIEAADEQQIARRFGRDAQQRKQNGPRVGLPIPLPRRGNDDPRKQVTDLEREMDAAMFKARAVEPHATQAGFFFFDVTDIDEPLAGAHLNAAGLRTGEGAELFFFDVPMDAYLKTRSRP